MMAVADDEPEILEETADLVLKIPLDLDEQSSADKKGFDCVTVEIFDADLLVPSTQRLATSTKTNVGCEVLCHRKGAERATSPSFARVADRR